MSHARPSLPIGRRRHYSDEPPKAEVEEGKDGSKESPVLTPEQEKLKAKEAEVIDLTVRVVSIKTARTLTSLA